MESDGTVDPDRLAVLSMDVEDWYHVDYLDRERCDRTYSMLDGLDVYLELLQRIGAPASFFCTGEVAGGIASRLREMRAAGHDIGSHGQTHRRALTITSPQFDDELRRSKETLESIVGEEVTGFRAPCFSMDDATLERVVRAGYRYDSSRIDFRANRRYGRMDLPRFEKVRDGIFRRDGFLEFQLSTVTVMGRSFPVSGGGYLRLLPWRLTRSLTRRFLEGSSLYVLYVHPYELSRRAAPPMPAGLGWAASRRFRGGLGTVEEKIEALAVMLRSMGFRFTTFERIRRDLCGG